MDVNTLRDQDRNGAKLCASDDKKVVFEPVATGG